MRDQLKSIVERNDTRAGLIFDLTIQALIVVSLISFSFETLPNLSPRTHRVLYGIECVTVFVFTVEYALRLTLADRKLSCHRHAHASVFLRCRHLLL